MKPNIELDIQRVIVEGFTENEAWAIKKALLERLQNRFANGSSESTNLQKLEVQTIKLPAINVKHSTRPEQIGNSIADHLYTSIIKPAAPKNH